MICLWQFIQMDSKYINTYELQPWSGAYGQFGVDGLSGLAINPINQFCFCSFSSYTNVMQLSANSNVPSQIICQLDIYKCSIERSFNLRYCTTQQNHIRLYTITYHKHYLISYHCRELVQIDAYVRWALYARLTKGSTQGWIS